MSEPVTMKAGGRSEAVAGRDERGARRKGRSAIARAGAFGAVAPFLLFALLAGACDGDSPTAPSTPANGTVEPLSSAALGAMSAALQDEYHAEAVYERDLLDFGSGTLPFADIVGAELRHSEAIARLYASRALAAPASEWSAATVASFSSLREACAASKVPADWSTERPAN